MQHIDESEKAGRKSALKKLMDLMGGEASKKLAGLKKPAAAEVSVTALPKDGAEPDGDEAADDGAFCAHCGKPR